jgi:hypothetical protein
MSNMTKTEATEHLGYEWRMFRTIGTLAEAMNNCNDPVAEYPSDLPRG